MSGSLFAKVLRLTLDQYATSILTVSDAQAAPFLVAIAQARSQGLIDEAEMLAGLLFSDLIVRRANVARGDIPATSILDFLEARAVGDYGAVLQLLERPDEITGVILRAGAMLGLGDVFEPHLWELDDHVFCTYVTTDYARFGQFQMEAGQNLVWTIGDTVFRLPDLNLSQPTAITAPGSLLLQAAVVLASLTYPDRVAWFLLEAANTATHSEAEVSA